MRCENIYTKNRSFFGFSSRESGFPSCHRLNEYQSCLDPCASLSIDAYAANALGKPLPSNSPVVYMSCCQFASHLLRDENWLIMRSRYQLIAQQTGSKWIMLYKYSISKLAGKTVCCCEHDLSKHQTVDREKNLQISNVRLKMDKISELCTLRWKPKL